MSVSETAKVKREKVVLSIYEVEECGEIWTILATSEDEALEYLFGHFQDIADDHYLNVDELRSNASVHKMKSERLIRVVYSEHDEEINLKAKQWIALMDSVKFNFKILASTAWT